MVSCSPNAGEGSRCSWRLLYQNEVTEVCRMGVFGC